MASAGTTRHRLRVLLESVCWITGRATQQRRPVRCSLHYLCIRRGAMDRPLLYGDATDRWNDGQVEPLLPDPPKLKIFKT